MSQLSWQVRKRLGEIPNSGKIQFLPSFTSLIHLILEDNMVHLQHVKANILGRGPHKLSDAVGGWGKLSI